MDTNNKGTDHFRNRIAGLLNQPFPIERDRGSDWMIISGISVFISLFLFGFQPFGLQNSSMPNKELFLTGYGGVTFIVLVLFLKIIPFVFKNVFIESRWTVKKHVLWLTLLIFIIGAGNYMYTISLTRFFAWSWQSFLTFQFFTLVIGIIPVSVMTLVGVNRHLKKNLAMAQSLNRDIHDKTPHEMNNRMIELKGKNKNEKLTLFPDQIYYFRSEGNYIRICFEQEGRLQKQMIRSTLASIKEQVNEADSIIPCHRMYLVNTDKIAEARGNAQGFILHLHDTDETVPVSRKYVPLIRESISR